MEIKENLREILVKSAESDKIEYGRIFNAYIQAVQSAETVEGLIEEKKLFLYDLVHYLPMSPRNCYFCLLHTDCEYDIVNKCGYSKAHGNCYKEDSDYQKITDIMEKLEDKILEFYYKGELY